MCNAPPSSGACAPDAYKSRVIDHRLARNDASRSANFQSVDEDCGMKRVRKDTEARATRFHRPGERSGSAPERKHLVRGVLEAGPDIRRGMAKHRRLLGLPTGRRARPFPWRRCRDPLLARTDLVHNRRIRLPWLPRLSRDRLSTSDAASPPDRALPRPSPSRAPRHQAQWPPDRRWSCSRPRGPQAAHRRAVGIPVNGLIDPAHAIGADLSLLAVASGRAP
jgi:hypothetical protein